MRTVEIIGFKRANLGKSESKRLRAEGNVPCVLYGGDEQIHFYAPAIQFRNVIYTPEPCFVNLNIEGLEFQAILQDSQFHPVSEVLLHADFLQLFEGKHIKMDIPVKTVGNAPGVANGGSLIIKRPKLTVKAFPAKMPESLAVNISKLKLGRSIKVSAITVEDCEILVSPLVTVATVKVPRALRGVAQEDDDDDDDDASSAEG